MGVKCNVSMGVKCRVHEKCQELVKSNIGSHLIPSLGRLRYIKNKRKWDKPAYCVVLLSESFLDKMNYPDCVMQALACCCHKEQLRGGEGLFWVAEWCASTGGVAACHVLRCLCGVSQQHCWSGTKGCKYKCYLSFCPHSSNKWRPSFR